MTKIDIVSGFLGAGKTTLIKKIVKEALQGQKVVLIENEFGEIGIDGGFLKDAGIEIKEMNSGCICCSLVGDFGTSLKEVLDTYKPERVLIEPSGVGKLSDVMKAVEDVKVEEVTLNSAVAVVDATKCRMYIKNFGEFFLNQIEHAGTIVLSRTDKMSEEKLQQAIAMIREHNAKTAIITTPWDELEGKVILEAIENAKDLEKELMEEVKKAHEHHHHDEHDHAHNEHAHSEHAHSEHGEDCTCGCHDHEHHHDEEHECCHEHHHGEHECCHEHHHDEEHECCHEHHHEEHECCHEHHHDEEHHHHHEHGEGCACGCHDHGHGHHHADEVFTSWGVESPTTYTKTEIERILEQLEDEKQYGFVLRAKGMVPAGDGTWVYFDYVPGESEVREGKPEYTGKVCVIGSQLKEDNLKALFTK